MGNGVNPYSPTWTGHRGTTKALLKWPLLVNRRGVCVRLGQVCPKNGCWIAGRFGAIDRRFLSPRHEKRGPKAISMRLRECVAARRNADRFIRYPRILFQLWGLAAWFLLATAWKSAAEGQEGSGGSKQGTGMVIAGPEANSTLKAPLLHDPIISRPQPMSSDDHLLIVVAAAGGIFILRKVLPRLSASLDTRENAEAYYVPLSEQLSREDRSFAEFATAFRVGPSASATSGQAEEKATAAPEWFEDTVKETKMARDFIAELALAPEEERQKILAGLGEEIGSLTRKLSAVEQTPGWQLSTALDGLIKQLAEKPSNLTASALHTLKGAVEMLAAVCASKVKAEIMANPPVRFLSVDDDAVCRLAMSLALKKALTQPDLAADGEAALALCQQLTYDVIFLDVEMPGMDGFELCSRIHENTLNRLTPVVFVTRHSDFDSRMKATENAAELIGKPFFKFEIAVKAVTLTLRKRMEAAGLPVRIKETPAPTAETPAAVPAEQPGGEVPKSAETPNAPAVKKPAVEAGETPLTAEHFAVAFFENAPTDIKELRRLVKAFGEAPNRDSSDDILGELYVGVHALAREAERSALRAALAIASSLEKLLKKLVEKPGNLTPSALGAADAALELLDELCDNWFEVDPATIPLRTLVVDDEPIARRAVATALQLALPKPDMAESGEAAVALATEHSYAVIFMDVRMPGMDGFVTASKIHESPTNEKTPIVFVTSSSDAESRAQATLSGGSGFIVKPVLPAEIALTAITFVLGRRMKKKQAQPIPEEVTALAS